MIEVILRTFSATIAALEVEIGALCDAGSYVVERDERHEADLTARNAELFEANWRMAKEITIGAAELKMLRAEVSTCHVDMLANETALAIAQRKNSARLKELVTSERALASARAEIELGAADLQVSETRLASSQAETRIGVVELRTSRLALAASRAETELGVADLRASELALASLRAETKVSVAELHASKLTSSQRMLPGLR